MPPLKTLSSALLRRGVGSVSIKGRDVTAAPAVNIPGDLNILDPPAAALPPAEGTLPPPTLAPPPVTAGSPPPLYMTGRLIFFGNLVNPVDPLTNRDPALTMPGARLNAARPAVPK